MMITQWDNRSGQVLAINVVPLKFIRHYRPIFIPYICQLADRFQTSILNFSSFFPTFYNKTYPHYTAAIKIFYIYSALNVQQFF